MFGSWTKTILDAMFSGVSMPMKVVGSRAGLVSPLPVLWVVKKTT